VCVIGLRGGGGGGGGVYHGSRRLDGFTQTLGTLKIYFFGPIIPRAVALFEHFRERFVVKKSEKEREIKRKSTRSNGSWTYTYI